MQLPGIKKMLFSFEESVDHLNDNYSRKFINRLFMIAGFPVAFNLAISMHWGRQYNLISILFLILFLGPTLGFIIYNIFTALLFVIGRIMNGISQYHGVKTALGVSLVSLFPIILIYLIMLLIYGKDMFYEELYTLEKTSFLVYLFLIFNLSFVILILITIERLIIALSRVQEFSWGKAFVNFIVAGFILGLILIFGGIISKFFLEEYPFY